MEKPYRSSQIRLVPSLTQSGGTTESFLNYKDLSADEAAFTSDGIGRVMELKSYYSESNYHSHNHLGTADLD